LRTELIKQGFKKKDIEKFFGSEFVDAAGVGVGATMKTSIGTLADRLGPVAFAEFKGVGSNLGQGIITGLNNARTDIAVASAKAIDAAGYAARKAGKIESPSKVFEEIRQSTHGWFGKGH